MNHFTSQRRVAAAWDGIASEVKGAAKAPGHDEGGSESESALDFAHGLRRHFAAYEMELRLGDPEQRESTESEGEREFSAFDG